MKKSLLMIGALAAGLSVGAQQSQSTIKMATPKHASTYEKPTEQQFSQEYPIGNPSTRMAPHAPAPLLTTEAVVGVTLYTLQTNSSMPHRLYYNSDGTISTCYTYAQGAWLSWPDRGSGYNYFDGTAWGANSTARIESGRTGFPDMVVLNNGFEMVTAHNTASSVMNFAYRPAKGSGPWSNTTGLISNPVGVTGYCLWPRMAMGGTNGDVIHHIAVTEPTGNGGALYHAQDGCLMYSRSNDGGATFAVQNQLLSAFDSTQSVGIGGDSYAIDARGDVVAIVIGGFGEDVVLAKSIDGGNTWTKTIVFDFPMPAPYDGIAMTDTNAVPDGIPDTLECSDASMSVLIDNNDVVHVWYGDMFVLSDGTQLSYFPGTAALEYWHEGMTAPVTVAGAEDLNSNGTLDVTAFGTYQVSLVSHPTSGIDATGNIYCAFSSIMEGTDDGTGKSFRNIYVMQSPDGGTTWTNPYNISPDLFSEKVYPSMARTVTSSAHIAYLRDQIAGHGVFTATNPDPDNQDVPHEWVVADVPVEDIVAGVHENTMNLTDVTLYPNPTNTVTDVMINLTKSQSVTVSVYNTTGQLISSEMKNLPAGASSIKFDVSKYPTGMYFVNVQEGTSMISKKLIIE
ncbi:hypothetical protein BH09BAC5_BH09BAC5_07010 [soil metagenome]